MLPKSTAPAVYTHQARQAMLQHTKHTIEVLGECSCLSEQQLLTSEGKDVLKRHKNQSVAMMDISQLRACKCLCSLGSLMPTNSCTTHFVCFCGTMQPNIHKDAVWSCKPAYLHVPSSV